MATTYTIDASVFVNAFNPYEPYYEVSRNLLSTLQKTAAPIIVPTLLLPEVAASISRGHNDAGLAQRFTATLQRLPYLLLIPVDTVLARQAADLAAQCRLRGADATYLAVAVRFGSALITLDREQQERSATVVPAYTPAEVLSSSS